jgi:anti-anti-sigma factor
MSDQVEASPGDVLYVETRQDGAGPIIIVVGEFDMTGTEVFWAHVSQAVEARPVSITVEARGLTFVDSSGLAAMVRAREAATDAGVTFRVSEPSPPLRRIAEICGLEGLLRLDGTSDAEPPPDP